MRWLMSLALVFGILVTLLGSAALGSSVDVALQSNGGTATADSVGTYQGYTGYAYHAIDGVLSGGTEGDMSWCGTETPGWLKVQFNSLYDIQQIAILFGSHQETYSVSLSPDNSTWTTVVPSRTSLNLEGTMPSQFESFDIAPTPARYMRMDITWTSAPPSHIWQTIVNEVEAFAPTPEPSTFVLLGVGAISLLAFGLRRRAS